MVNELFGRGQLPKILLSIDGEFLVYEQIVSSMVNSQ